MAERTVRVRALVSRYIGDDHYAAGEYYRVATGRAQKYAALGDFEIVPEPEPLTGDGADHPDPAVVKQAEPPDNKMRGRPEDKAG